MCCAQGRAARAGAVTAAWAAAATERAAAWLHKQEHVAQEGPDTHLPSGRGGRSVSPSSRRALVGVRGLPPQLPGLPRERFDDVRGSASWPRCCRDGGRPLPRRLGSIAASAAERPASVLPAAAARPLHCPAPPAAGPVDDAALLSVRSSVPCCAGGGAQAPPEPEDAAACPCSQVRAASAAALARAAGTSSSPRDEALLRLPAGECMPGDQGTAWLLGPAAAEVTARWSAPASGSTGWLLAAATGTDPASCCSEAHAATGSSNDRRMESKGEGRATCGGPPPGAGRRDGGDAAAAWRASSCCSSWLAWPSRPCSKCTCCCCCLSGSWARAGRSACWECWECWEWCSGRWWCGAGWCAGW